MTRKLICRSMLAAGLLAPAAARAQQQDDVALAHRALADRASLQAVATRLAARGADEPEAAAAITRVRSRLTEGDFHPGDLVVIEVQGEPTLTDTFTVDPGPELRLPAPVVGTLSLKGLLRSELEPKVKGFIGQFVQEPVVRARPLIRLAIHGDVVKGGVYGVPADAVLGDALMAAGGSTQVADWKKLRIERDGEPLLKGKELAQAISSGVTVDAAGLRDGDQIVVPRRDVAGVQGNLRFLWVIVSLTGGIYGLTRAF